MVATGNVSVLGLGGPALGVRSTKVTTSGFLASQQVRVRLGHRWDIAHRTMAVTNGFQRSGDSRLACAGASGPAVLEGSWGTFTHTVCLADQSLGPHLARRR
jgi:hypothetical protein